MKQYSKGAYGVYQTLFGLVNLDNSIALFIAERQSKVPNNLKRKVNMKCMDLSRQVGTFVYAELLRPNRSTISLKSTTITPQDTKLYQGIKKR